MLPHTTQADDNKDDKDDIKSRQHITPKKSFSALELEFFFWFRELDQNTCSFQTTAHFIFQIALQFVEQSDEATPADILLMKGTVRKR